MPEKAYQQQMFDMAPNEKDVVYTPGWLAKELIDYFKPSGSILEPCAGDNAFLKYLPTAAWCEITKGKDFFLCHDKFDWVFGNPPYKIFGDWLRHSFEIAENIMYLIPINKIYNSYGTMKEIKKYGGVSKIYVIGRGELANFTMGYPVGGVHFKKNYKGGTYHVFREDIIKNSH